MKVVQFNAKQVERIRDVIASMGKITPLSVTALDGQVVDLPEPAKQVDVRDVVFEREPTDEDHKNVQIMYGPRFRATKVRYGWKGDLPFRHFETAEIDAGVA